VALAVSMAALAGSSTAAAQVLGPAGGAKTYAPAAFAKNDPVHQEPHWYDAIKIRGYTQLRYNGLYQSDRQLVNEQGDRSLGGDPSFFIRRARLILHGDVHPLVFIYLQPDFANVLAENTHVVALRDWYADLALDKDREFRFRVGQSKIPYGFENMQSSSNRLALDRSDPINSAAANERDLGVFFYWAPKEIRARFKHLVDSGLKGSGDYGLIGLGAYNGQTANKREPNANKHLIARVAYPFLIGKQFVELNLGGYNGRFVVSKDKEIGGGEEFKDIRAYAAVIVYPQPFGFQAEWNFGIGPEYDSASKSIREQRLQGGYAMVTYKAGPVMPYARAVTYEGGKKHEKNTPSYSLRELSLGVEWQIHKAAELTVEYLIGDRTNPTTQAQVQGQTLRLQMQFNY
jgi:hypothetical protein